MYHHLIYLWLMYFYVCFVAGVFFHHRGLSHYAASFKKAGINDVEYLLRGPLALSDIDKLGIRQV